MLNERDLYRLQRMCDIDQWYDALKEETMRTEFIPLSMEEGNALFEGWRSLKGTFSQKQVEKAIGQPVLGMLKKKLDSLLATFPEGAFMRLGTRSPKDSRVAEERGKKFLESLDESNKPPQTFNEELTRKLRSQIAGLRVRTATEMFDLFFTSNRIGDDLEEMIEHSDPPTMVIRGFEEIDPTTELRLFIKDGQVVAISQYNYLIVSERLVRNREKYLENALNLHARIKDRIPLPSYILDIGFLQGEPARPRVIEINPYCVGTSACLFRWKEDFAMGAKVPAELEFRVRTQPLKKET